MAVRRFETLATKPVRFWEVELVDRTLRTRSSDEPLREETCKSDRAAAARLEALIAERRADGFVEIKRVAVAAPREEPVSRDRELEWQAGVVRHYRVYKQRDLAVTEERGYVFRAGREQTEFDEHRHATIAEASATFDRLVAAGRSLAAPVVARRKAGSLDDVPARPRGELAVEPGLEARCREAALDDAEPFRVYADWLIEHGDPRGDIAGLALGGRPHEARAMLEAHFRLLWPEELELFFTLRHGFVRRVCVDTLAATAAVADTVARVLASPLGTFVDAIEVVLFQGVQVADWTPVVDAVVDSNRASALRELALRSHDKFCTARCDLSRLWTAAPLLERFELDTDGDVIHGEIDAPSLRVFIRRMEGIDDAEHGAFVTAHWPALAHLELDFTGDAGGIDSSLDNLLALLAVGNLPSLRHLAILGWDAAHELVVVLSNLPLLARLESLDLRRGFFGADATRALADRAPAYRHLASLDLSDGHSTADDIERVRAKLDNVIFSAPAPDEPDDDHYDDIDE